MEGSSEAGGQFNQQTHRGHHHGTGTWHWHMLRVTALLPRYGIPTRFGKASLSTQSSETVHHLVHGGITTGIIGLELLGLVEIRLLIQSPHTTKSMYCFPSTVFLGPLATLARTCEHHSELSPGHRWAHSPVPSLHELPFQFALFVQMLSLQKCQHFVSISHQFAAASTYHTDSYPYSSVPFGYQRYLCPLGDTAHQCATGPCAMGAKTTYCCERPWRKTPVEFVTYPSVSQGLSSSLSRFIGKAWSNWLRCGCFDSHEGTAIIEECGILNINNRPRKDGHCMIDIRDPGSSKVGWTVVHHGHYGLSGGHQTLKTTQ